MTTTAQRREADALAGQIAALKRRVADLERAPRLSHASIEGEPLPIFDDNQVLRQTIGRQDDGTYTVVDVNGPPPPVPSPPIVEARPGALVVTWDGQFANGATAPADWDHVEVHISTTSGYTPTDETEVITFHSLKGGSVTLALDSVAHYVILQAVSTSRTESAPTTEVPATPLPPTTGEGGVQTFLEPDPPVGLDADDDGALWYDTNDGNHPYRWNGSTLVWVSIQDAAIGTAQETADDALAAATSDGIAPTSSPDPAALSVIGMFIVKWTPITNPDPVRYQVHVSTTLGFTADSTTLVGTTTSSQFTVRALPGPEPDPGEPDPRTLQYGTPYYVRIVATDDDGAAPQSLQAVASIFQVTGVDIAFDSVTAANIRTGTLTGELFAASVIMAGTFKTAETGQRIEFGIAGIKGYKSDGALMLSFPTEDGEEALFDGELIARGLTVLGGASFQSMDNEFTADSAVTLMRGIVSPSATPQLQVTYDTVQPSTTSLSAAQKTGTDPTWGLGGPFDLVPSEVSYIRWVASGSYWVFYQIRPNGTRKWYFNPDGTPKDVSGLPTYFHDVKNWEIWAEFEMTTSTPAKNGTYTMFRLMPNQDYWVSAPPGFNRYSRQNGVAPPTIGNNGTDMFVAEVINTDDLSIRYFVPNGNGGNMPAPTTAYQSTTGYTAGRPLACVTYHPTGFDLGVTTRYLTAERGYNSNARLVNTNGTNLDSIFPGGSGNNWSSPNKEAESFESPTSNRRCTAWDGANFWTYGADGFLYKHTTEQWDPAVLSSTYWAKQTFYDSDSGGTGTHETTPGEVKSYTAKRRSKNAYTPPVVPDNGGADDPDKVRLYMARGSSSPANSAYHLQYEGTAPTTFTTLATATATPPTTNSFPASNPAKIRNDDDTLVISGDGSIKGSTIKRGTDNVAIEGPYAYCILNGAHSTAGAAFSNITNWQAEVTAFGIILTSGTTLTVPRTGKYRVTLQLAYPTSVNTGSIWADVRKNGTSTVAVTFVGTPNGAHSATVGGSRTISLAANDTLQCRSFKSQAGAVNLPTGPELVFWQVEWRGP